MFLRRFTNFFFKIINKFYRYDHPDILAGQGTIGLEILEDVPDLDCILVPIGGGGLIAGIAAAAKGLKPKIKIIVKGIGILTTIYNKQTKLFLGSGV